MRNNNLSTKKELDKFFNDLAVLLIDQKYRDPKPDFYKTVSMDAPLPYADGLTLHDMISENDYGQRD